jgi:hypothetical protein
MRIFRLEDKHGYGPFVSGHVMVHEEAAGKRTLHTAYEMPSPFSDPKLNHLKHDDIECIYKFGFKSVAQMKRAFRSARGRERMAECGMRLVEYEVSKEHVIMGETQLIFRIGKEQFVRTLVLD